MPAPATAPNAPDCARSPRAGRRTRGSRRIRRTGRPGCSSEFDVGGTVGGDLRLVAVADRQQHFHGVIEVAALLPVVLENAGLDEGVDRAALLAISAED